MFGLLFSKERDDFDYFISRAHVCEDKQVDRFLESAFRFAKKQGMYEILSVYEIALERERAQIAKKVIDYISRMDYYFSDWKCAYEKAYNIGSNKLLALSKRRMVDCRSVTFNDWSMLYLNYRDELFLDRMFQFAATDGDWLLVLESTEKNSDHEKAAIEKIKELFRDFDDWIELAERSRCNSKALVLAVDMMAATVGDVKSRWLDVYRLASDPDLYKNTVLKELNL